LAMRKVPSHSASKVTGGPDDKVWCVKKENSRLQGRVKRQKVPTNDLVTMLTQVLVEGAEAVGGKKKGFSAPTFPVPGSWTVIRVIHPRRGLPAPAFKHGKGGQCQEKAATVTPQQ